MSRYKDLLIVLRGLETVTRAMGNQQRAQVKRTLDNSSLTDALKSVGNKVEEVISDGIVKRSDMEKTVSSVQSMVTDFASQASRMVSSMPLPGLAKKTDENMDEMGEEYSHLLDRAFEPGYEELLKSDAAATETESKETEFPLHAPGSHDKSIKQDSTPSGGILNNRTEGGNQNLEKNSQTLNFQSTTSADQRTLNIEHPIVSNTPLSETMTITPEDLLNAEGFSRADDSVRGKEEPHSTEQTLSERSKERKVPSTRIGRAATFGSLAAGLGVGALSEMAKRTLGLKKSGGVASVMDSNVFLTEANAERIVNTLCRVRGAALKLGQMISIQDSAFINPQLQKIFQRVRDSADFMPAWQVEKVMTKELGPDWRNLLAEFDSKPFAAASIGQVHHGVLFDGREVAIKIQYPGVAKSIDSDINNLMGIMKMWNILPEGMHADSAMSFGRKELNWECNYVREAASAKKFKELLKDDHIFYIPALIDDLSRREVITLELIQGIPLDKCVHLDQETRNNLSKNLLRLCLKELFLFRFMQTDPNWSNFFYIPETKKIALLDFGASHKFPKSFVDVYIKVIRAAADGDRDGVLHGSRELGFLTGYETKVMEQAHIDTVMILGEAFANDGPFDFAKQDTTRRVHDIIPVMLKHRLTPPPEESYSLHRKMSGSFLLCTQLSANINCKELFDDVWRQYDFDGEDDEEDIWND